MSAVIEDSHMLLSSPDDSDHNKTSQERTQVLTPPASQHSRNMPTSASGSSIANSNGKRPIQTISNGNDDMEELAAMGNGKARQDLPVKTHPTSGYTWSRMEDEPGHSWNNKKAFDESLRAWENMQHKDRMIKNTYGDPFELVEKEQAILASLKQR